jgi:hypothetical protein
MFVSAPDGRLLSLKYSWFSSVLVPEGLEEYVSGLVVAAAFPTVLTTYNPAAYKFPQNKLYSNIVYTLFIS